MGFFSSKYKTYVASTTYNMAGDEDLRPNVLRSIIVSGILGSKEKSLGRHVYDSLKSGPASKRAAFFRWAKKSYIFGLPNSHVKTNTGISNEQARAGLLPLLSLTSNQSVRVMSAMIDDADIQYWAERWVLENHPDLDEDEWEAEWISSTQKIKITLNDNSETLLSAPADLLWGAAGEGRKLLYILYAVATQNTTTKVVTMGAPILFTYRMGQGNLIFDALAGVQNEETEFFPSIPLRIDKKPISHADYAEYFPNINKAYKRLTGAHIEDLLDQIEDNDNLEDLDAVYVIQGVSLNTKEKAGKEYIYKFLKKLSEFQYANQMETYIRPTRTEIGDTLSVTRWLTTHGDADVHSPNYNDTFTPDRGVIYTNSPSYELQVRNDESFREDNRLVWYSIIETNHVGNAKTYDGNTTRGLAKVGEYWFAKGPNKNFVTPATDERRGSLGFYTFRSSLNQVYLLHQYAPLRYRKLTCIGLTHKNFVYGDSAVTTLASDALDDEDESSFLVPLHMPTLKSMGLVKSNQLSTCSNYLVFNSYKRVKVKWYQRGFFRIIMVIVGIALSIVTAGGGLAAAGGLLGNNMALGLSIGASATSAAIVGAIANAIAAVVVSTLVQKASVKLFGNKLGAMIGVIAGFLGIMYGTQFAMHGNFAVDWGQFARIDRLMDLTNVAGKAYSAWLNADTLEVQAQMNGLTEEYENRMDEISDLSREVLGMTSGEIDPMMILDASEHFGESSEVFLSRTLLTGSDLAALTHLMVENFAEISLELPGSNSTV